MDSQGFNGSTLLYEITWNFADEKTVAQRFDNAVAVGEAVTWTVTAPSIIGSQVFSGVWRWSNEANGGSNYATRFAGTDTNFSTDDGVWGAGNGVIDAGSGGDSSLVAWGIGNFNTNDGSARLFLDGVDTPIDPSFQNLVFVNDALAGAAPELNAVTASLPAAFALIALLVLGDSKRKRGLSAPL